MIPFWTFVIAVAALGLALSGWVLAELENRQLLRDLDEADREFEEYAAAVTVRGRVPHVLHAVDGGGEA